VSSALAQLGAARRVKSSSSVQLSSEMSGGTSILQDVSKLDTSNHTTSSYDKVSVQRNVQAALDKSAQFIAGEGHSAFVHNLTDTLRALKASVDQEAWNSIVIPAARRHPLVELVHECPLTRHSFTRPRGYPGDASLLDLIYRHDSAEEQVAAATSPGRAVFDFTVEVSACEAVRQRRKLLARMIDQVAEERPGATMLAIACGHLREAELSNALMQGKVGRFLATDQDLQSLEVVKGYTASISSAIEARKLSVRDFIGAKHGLGGFDFIYAAGLYDYLEERLASRLTKKLFSLLKPGGRVLVANFLTGIWELPYMEAYMDWHLLYRSEEQIRAFASEISLSDVSRTSYFSDKTGCVGYLEIERL
jgi:extracellular factor (EF) 3-hydroxypalmitic acid methyl ester biosynthesis protein